MAKKTWKALDKFVENDTVKHTSRIPEKKGVYFIRWGSRNKPISRLSGQDENKILYIGHAGNLEKRIVSQFIRGFNEIGKDDPHMPHPAIIKINDRNLDKEFALGDLEVYWNEYNNKKIAAAQEYYALKFYTKRYGELPPLNQRMNKPELGEVDSIDESIRNIIK